MQIGRTGRRWHVVEEESFRDTGKSLTRCGRILTLKDHKEFDKASIRWRDLQGPRGGYYSLCSDCMGE